MLDAGAGSVPALSVYAALSSERVHVTALEINPTSAFVARGVVAALGLSEQITVVEADATQYQPTTAPALLVSETMHAGLIEEPIVQIFSNLQPHVAEGGITLPDRVDVKAGLVSYDEWRHRADLVRVLRNRSSVVHPDWQDVVSYRPGDPLETIAFDLDTVAAGIGQYMVAVTCDVSIGALRLGQYDSLISSPQYTRERDRRSDHCP